MTIPGLGGTRAIQRILGVFLKVSIIFPAMRSRTTLMVFCYLLVLLFGVLDYFSGPMLSLSILYFIPIVLLTWNAGVGYGIAAAAASAVVWLIADSLWSVVYLHSAIPYWNAVARFGVFLILVLLVSRVKTANKGLHQALTEKTANLEAELAERKRAQEELTKLSRAIKQTADSVLIASRDGTIEYVNPAFERLTGYSKEEVIGKTPSILKSGKHVEQFYRSLWETILSGYIFRTEFINKRKSGELYHQEETITPIVNGDGSVVHFVSTGRDVTERKRVEEELRKSEGKFRAIFDNTSDGMFLFDLKAQRFFMCNATCATMLGYTQEEFLNLDIADIHPGEDLPFIYEQIGEFDKGERGVRSDIRFKRKDGSILVADLSPALVAIAEKQYLVISFRDISERKRVEEKLRRSYEQLHHFAVSLQSSREEERSRIAREIHDELGQALTGLKFDISWIGKKLPEGTEELQSKTKAMGKLIDGTIQMVRKMSSELRPGVLDRLGLAAAIEWQVQEFQNRTGIKCTRSPNFEGLKLEQDRATAIFRIFQEALTNVARHANASTVDVSLSVESGNLILEVRDNGKGISESALLDPKSLGLLGMKERALAFGGRVNIVGRPGSGTRVILIVPCDSVKNKGETS
jgi:PAS domain S-box-containing protein